MDNIPYKNRTHAQLDKALRSILNKLQMRDWEVEFVTGAIPPKGLEDKYDNSASASYRTDMLKAVIFVNTVLCKERNEDPLWNMYHEVFHIWLAYQENEERQCNILAALCV